MRYEVNNLLLMHACRSRCHDGNDQVLDYNDSSEVQTCEVTAKTGAIRMIFNILHERGL